MASDRGAAVRASLSRALHVLSEQYATVDELAVISGMTREETIEGIGELLDARDLAIESEGGDIFLLTAPGGRTPDSKLPANVWEILREDRTITQAGRSYRVCRSLERGGWRVVLRPERKDIRLARVTPSADLGVIVGTDVVPVLIDPDYRGMGLSNSVLSEYNTSGAKGVGVTCPQGRLDDTVTAARKWMMSRPGGVHCYVLIMEAPRYAPVFVTNRDGGVTAVSHHLG